tara:strand:+ start:279 stop:668 length:390 start_codon:yes stop_codon:yes gene_type:complete
MKTFKKHGSFRAKPNLVMPIDDKGKVNDFVQNVFDDMFVTQHTPDSISLDGVIFTLTLSNKKFLYEELKTDSNADFIDIYLQAVKQPATRYLVTDNGTNVIVTFNQSITDSPGDISASDFTVKGKIVDR